MRTESIRLGEFRVTTKWHERNGREHGAAERALEIKQSLAAGDITRPIQLTRQQETLSGKNTNNITENLEIPVLATTNDLCIPYLKRCLFSLFFKFGRKSNKPFQRGVHFFCRVTAGRKRSHWASLSPTIPAFKRVARVTFIFYFDERAAQRTRRNGVTRKTGRSWPTEKSGGAGKWADKTRDG